MCPDKQLLSAYYDGEVPSPWREKIDVHLEECAACRDTAARYHGLSKMLRASYLPEPETAAFTRIRARTLESGTRRAPLWRKRVSLPLAAAAALIFFGSGMALTLFTRAMPETDSIVEYRLRRTEDAAKVQNMDELLALLAKGDSGSELTITLPERNFHTYGKPVFFRAEDFLQGKKQ